MFTLNTYRQDDFSELVTFFFPFFIIFFFTERAWDAIINNVSFLNPSGCNPAGLRFSQ